MPIKFDGKDLQKRIINGKEVEKIMYNGIQIRPDGGGGGGWEPTEQTIAYWPIDSTSTTMDESGNNRDLTAVNMSYGPYYASFPSNNRGESYFYYNDFQIPSGSDFFMCVRGMAGDTPAEENPRLLGNGSGDRGYWIAIDRAGKRIQFGEPAVTGQSIILDIENTVIGDYQWILYYYTGTIGGQARGGLIDTQGRHLYNTGTAKVMPTGLTIGTNGSPSWRYYDSWRGLMGEIIVEDDIWDTQKIMDYYNQQKGRYGL